jgi:DNA-binding transcriptional LysR family regulator
MDAGLVVLPVAAKGIAAHPVSREPLCAVIPAKHELAKAQSLRLCQLRDLPLICAARRLHPDCYQQLLQMCLRYGFDPVVTQEVTTFAEAAAMVAEGLGITFAQPWQERFFCPGLVFRRIEDCPLAVDSAVAYRQTSRSEVLDRLIAALAKKPLASVAMAMPGHDSQIKAS